MNLNMRFNAREHSCEQGGAQLPLGDHLVMIVGEEVRVSEENQNNSALVLQIEVCEGPYRGARGSIWLGLWYTDHEKQAVIIDMATTRLSAICHAVGVYDLSDTDQIKGRPFGVKVGKRKNDPDYTEVKRILNTDFTEVGSSTTPPAQAAQQANQQQYQQQQQGYNQQPGQNSGNWNQPVGNQQQGQGFGSPPNQQTQQNFNNAPAQQQMQQQQYQQQGPPPQQQQQGPPPQQQQQQQGGGVDWNQVANQQQQMQQGLPPNQTGWNQSQNQGWNQQ